MLKGFRDFLLRGNVVDLAVAVMIGAAFTAIVTSFTTNIIGPLIAATVHQPDFSALVLDIHGGKLAYGKFLDSIINFLIVASVIYFIIVLPTQYLLKRFKGPEVASTKPCPQCLSDVPLAATRCKFCTQAI